MTLQELIDSLKQQKLETLNQQEQPGDSVPENTEGTNDLSPDEQALDNQNFSDQEGEYIDNVDGILDLMHNFWWTISTMIMSKDEALKSGLAVIYNVFDWHISMRYSPDGKHTTSVTGPITNIILKHVSVSPYVIKGYMNYLLNNGYEGTFTESRNVSLLGTITHNLVKE